MTILGISCSGKKNKDAAMLLWEDDYLMIEIMSSQNMEFANSETTRTKEFEKKHASKSGYSAITEIRKKNKETKDLNIEISDFVEFLRQLEIYRYPKLMYYGGGDPTEITNPKTMAFGQKKTAIFIEQEDEVVKNMWFVTYNWQDVSKTNINLALKAIGDKYDMIMVDWFKGQIIDLKNQKEVESYLTKE